MPIFDSAKGDIPWHMQPSNGADQFGSSGSSMQAEGTLYRQVSSPGVTPASTGADIVLMSFAIPASAFDGAVIPTAVASTTASVLSNRGVAINAIGSFAATSNNKRVKIVVGCTSAVVGSAVVGGTAIADTAVVTTSGAGWSIAAEIYKYGAAGSNTQLAVHQPTQVGAAVASLLAPQSIALAESGAILVAITGNATTAASDILANLLVISGMN